LKGWPADFLYCSGKQVRTLVKDLKGLIELINTHKTDPYNDLNQLSKRYMHLPLTPSGSSIVYVIAPIYRKLNPIVLYKNGHLHGILKCHASLKPSDFLLSVVYNSDAGEKVGDFHVSFKDRKTRKKFHEIKFKDTKEKSNVSNAIVSLASSTDCIRIYRKELRPSKIEDVRSQIQFKVDGSTVTEDKLSNEESRNKRVFISYAREDSDEALRLYNDLKAHTDLRPWLDKKDLLPGQKWQLEIRNAIHNSRYFIVLFSSVSVQKDICKKR
jgi:TIR domain-containing protein